MVQLVNKFLKKILLINPIYSQEGEDIILSRIFSDNKNGFFVDVGAHHPKRFSNTYLLYLKGWKGINIDPIPGTKKRFDKIRPRDITLEIGVSEKEEELLFHIFNEPALNTFSEKEAKEKEGSNNGKYKIIKKTRVKTYPLSTILDQYVPENQLIDFLTVDAEGLDLQVLKSNNWEKYKPSIILVEDLARNDLDKINESEIFQYLISKGYKLIVKTYNTLFFENKK